MIGGKVSWRPLPWRSSQAFDIAPSSADDGTAADYQLAALFTFDESSDRPVGRPYCGPQANLVAALLTAGIQQASGRDCHGERGKTRMYDIHVYTSPTAPPRVVFRTEECGVIERYVGVLNESTVASLHTIQ